MASDWWTKVRRDGDMGVPLTAEADRERRGTHLYNDSYRSASSVLQRVKHLETCRSRILALHCRRHRLLDCSLRLLGQRRDRTAVTETAAERTGNA
jgi:hypothetical protein